ncbi:MAG: radical SAM protein, partial [Fibrobacterota bacterium]
MEENKPNLADYNTAELRQVFEKAGQPAYRARQFIEFVYKKGVRDFGGITSYPVTLREKLASDYSLSFPREIIRKKSPSDGAVKFALETSGGLTESVVMPGAKGATLCVSSQLGCAMGCVFCATGKMGLKKSLSPSGILGQVLTAESILKEENKRIRNIVFMGMGEPLRNIGSLSRVLDILLSPFGHGFSPDRITVSTAGLLDEMRKILRLFPGVRPAISLNAAND